MSFMSVRLSAWNNSTPTGGIFKKFYIWVFFENLPRIFKFHQNRIKITGTSREDQNTFVILSHSVLLRLRNVSDKIFRQNQNTNFTFSNMFFENRTVYEIMWENTVEPNRHCMLHI